MPASDIRFVLRIPVKLYKELQAVKKAGSGLPSINTQILRRLGNPDEEEPKQSPLPHKSTPALPPP